MYLEVLSSLVCRVVTAFYLHPSILFLGSRFQQKTARQIMDDLEVLSGVSGENDDLWQSSSDMEIQVKSLEYEGSKEQASVPQLPLRVRPSEFVSSNASNGH